MNKLDYKFFWTWDHCTNWQLDTPGMQNAGASNFYTKDPDIFEKDYRRVIDWSSAHGINAIGIAGLLRDNHGGIESARKVCSYALEKGVRIYMIAGLFAYGGIYYEGEQDYSLERFLRLNPDCMAIQENGNPLIFNFWSYGGNKSVRHACPSNPKVQKFVLDSLEWLFHTIPELGGIQIETGDTGICQCDACRKRRSQHCKPEDDSCSKLSLHDMAMFYPQAANAVYSVNPDAWVICETYHHFICDSGEEQDRFGGCLPAWAPELLTPLPKEVFLQWVCDAKINDGTWHIRDSFPAELAGFRNIMRGHHSTYWMRCRRGGLSVDRIRQHCLLSADAGLAGVSAFGEHSPFNTNTEFNYLALEYFANRPDASTEQFTDEIMAPLLGGDELGRRYYEFASLPADSPLIQDTVRQIGSLVPNLDYSAARRWTWLANYLAMCQWNLKGF